MAIVRRIEYKSKKYIITYDTERLLDTVQDSTSGEFMEGNHRTVQFILRHADELLTFENISSVKYL